MNFRENKLLIISLFILFPFIPVAEGSNFEKVWQYEINYIDYANTVQSQAKEFKDLILVVDGIGNLNALDKKTGVLVYQTALGKNVGRRGFAIDEETGQIIIAADSTLYILDAKSGVILKQTKTIKSTVTPILTPECIIVFGSIDGNIRCHSRNLDEIFWQTKLGKTARIWSNVTMSKKYNKIYLITSNAGGIVAEKRAPDTYSSSLVAIDATSGSIEFSHQMIKDDVWDFDGVGKPIYVESFINDDGEEYDVIIGLNKTGTIFAVNAENGSPIKDGQFEKKKFSKGTGINASVADSQIIPSWPMRINEIFLTPDNLRLDEMKPGALRHSRFEEFLPPSLDYDVITRGIHGGPEWQGGLHYKNNDYNLLAIPFNNTSFILRLMYVAEDGYIIRGLIKIKELISNTKNFTKNSIFSIKKIIFGEKKNLVKSSKEYLDKNSQKNGALVVDNKKILNPWTLNAWSDRKNRTTQIKDKIYKFVNIKAYNGKYYKHCASCHRNDRAGRYQNEFVGDGFVPSLVGYSLTKKYEYGKNYDNFVTLHGSNVDVSKEDFDKILKFYDKYDKQQLKKDNLRVSGFWQSLNGDDALPLNKGPWGGVAIINLNTGKKIKDIVVGKMKKSDGNLVDSSIIFGGLGPVNSSGETLLVGTVDPKAYYISIPEAKVLHSFDLRRPGSAAPYLTQINGCEAWVVVESGGRFSFYDKSLNGYTIEMYVNKSRCKTTNETNLKN